MQALTFAAHALTTYTDVMKQHRPVEAPHTMMDHGQMLMASLAPVKENIVDPVIDFVNPLSKEEQYDLYLENMNINIEFAHSAWKGLYSGLYGKETKY